MKTGCCRSAGRSNWIVHVFDELLNVHCGVPGDNPESDDRNW